MSEPIDYPCPACHEYPHRLDCPWSGNPHHAGPIRELTLEEMSEKYIRPIVVESLPRFNQEYCYTGPTGMEEK